MTHTRTAQNGSPNLVPADVAITKEVANDLPAFFTKHPNITHVFFNGKEAREKFRRHVLPSLAEDQHIYKRLPSTSPLYTITLDRKVQAWRVVVEALTALPPASKPKKSIRWALPITMDC